MVIKWSESAHYLRWWAETGWENKNQLRDVLREKKNNENTQQQQKPTYDEHLNKLNSNLIQVCGFNTQI